MLFFVSSNISYLYICLTSIINTPALLLLLFAWYVILSSFYFPSSICVFEFNVSLADSIQLDFVLAWLPNDYRVSAQLSDKPMISVDLVLKYLKSLQGLHCLLIHMCAWGGSGGRGVHLLQQLVFPHSFTLHQLLLCLPASPYACIVSQSARDRWKVHLSPSMAPSIPKSTHFTKLVQHQPQPELSPWASQVTDSPICFLSIWTHLADKASNQDYPLQQKVYYFCGILPLSGKTTVLAFKLAEKKKRDRKTTLSKGTQTPVLIQSSSVFLRAYTFQFSFCLQSTSKAVKRLFFTILSSFVLVCTEIICNLFMPPKPENIQISFCA